MIGRSAGIVAFVVGSGVAGAEVVLAQTHAAPGPPGNPQEGLVVRSTDGAFELRFRGLFQFDGRFFIGDDEPAASATFLVRRIRPTFESSVYKVFAFRLTPDFGDGTATLFDAYFDLRLRPALVMRAGKFKPPVGLERLQSAEDLVFVERGLPTNLVPSRDHGVQVHGDVRDGAVSYAVAVLNGAADLGQGGSDGNDGKDLAVRAFGHPFRGIGPSWIAGLGIGLAASLGDHEGAPVSPGLASYRSPAQRTIFAYRTAADSEGAVIAAGRHSRVSPQAYLYAGPVGVLFEYVRSSGRVRQGLSVADLDHTAWQAAGSLSLSGDRVSYRGLTPSSRFDPDAGTWGGFELAARVGALEIDPAAFPRFADPRAQVRKARSWGLGFNWYLVRGIRVLSDYDRTRFTGGAVAGDRETEHLVTTRVQYAF